MQDKCVIGIQIITMEFISNYYFPTDREKFTPYTLHTYAHRYYVLRWKDEQRSLRPAN